MSIRYFRRLYSSSRYIQRSSLYQPTRLTVSQTSSRPFQNQLRTSSSSSTRKPHFATSSLRSGTTTLASSGGIGLSIIGILVWSTSSYSTPNLDLLSKPLTSKETLDASIDPVPWVRVYPGMPPQTLPGRPGNLTHEEEVKLKELWDALMSVFGLTSTDIETASTAAPASINTPDKKKRRFGGLLGGKKSDHDGSDSAAEDKYGQSKEYKQALASQSPEELRDTFWSFTKMDDPDAVLLRFLRARKWKVHDALVMLVSTIYWRSQTMHLDDDIMKNGEGGALELANKGSGQAKKVAEDFLTQMRMGKSFLHGFDRDGRPLCFVRVKLHRGGEQTEESLERYTVYTIELARCVLRPPVDTAVIVFDMTDFSMANMDYTPVKFMIKVFEANYPESLGHVLVHKSPWIFQSVWAIIKGWLDPVVASKVHFTKNSAELSEFIDMKHIPKGLGGQEDWEYRYVEPEPGENKLMQDTATRAEVEKERSKLAKDYEAATTEWMKSEKQGDAAQGRRLQLAEALRHNYWKLDPYVRARSLYDRIGVVQHGGVINAPKPVNAVYGPTGDGPRMSTDTVASVYHDASEHV